MRAEYLFKLNKEQIAVNDNILIQYRQVEYIIYWSKFQTIIYIFEIFLKCHIISLWLSPLIFCLSSDATYGGLCYFEYLRFCNITIGCHMRYQSYFYCSYIIIKCICNQSQEVTMRAWKEINNDDINGTQ